MYNTCTKRLCGHYTGGGGKYEITGAPVLQSPKPHDTAALRIRTGYFRQTRRMGCCVPENVDVQPSHQQVLGGVHGK